MTDATRERYRIVVVTATEPADHSLRLFFGDGTTAVLPADHPNAEILAHPIHWSLEYGRPVGVVTDAEGQVIDLREAHESKVNWVRPDEEDPRCLEVALWEFSPGCCLLYDHPEFERIRTTLTGAIANRTRVWLAARSEPFESNTAIYHSLMDVRPADAVVGAFEALRTREANAAAQNGPTNRAVTDSEILAPKG
jgi:hypothetical protein